MHECSDEEILALIEEALRSDSELPKVELKDAQGGLTPKLFKGFSAFSNTAGGGIIVFGIAEDRTKTPKLRVVGIANPHDFQERIYQYVDAKIHSPGEYTIRPLRLSGNDIVALCVSELPLERKPCYYIDTGINRGSFIRVGNVNRPATHEEVRSFLMYSPEYKYDQRPLKTVNPDILNKDKIIQFLNDSALRTGRALDGSTNYEKNLANLKLTTEDAGIAYATYAGALLFYNGIPQEIAELNRYIVRCVRYSDKTVSSDIIDTLDIDGTLDNQVDQTIAFVLRNIPRSAQLVKAKRIETYEYPEDALREVIVNAIIHRDYSISQTYVQVAIFSDRIEIANPGTLPPGVTVDNLKESQFSRNTTIAAIMRDLKYMEEFGRGIDLIYSRLREWGLPEPLFKNKSNMFKAILLGRAFNQLNERQIAIWNAIQERNSLTSRAVREMFPEVSRASINNDLRKLVEANLITPSGSGINTFYEPNY